MTDLRLKLPIMADFTVLLTNVTFLAYFLFNTTSATMGMEPTVVLPNLLEIQTESQHGEAYKKRPPSSMDWRFHITAAPLTSTSFAKKAEYNKH